MSDLQHANEVGNGKIVKPRTFFVTDIHGAYLAFKQCLELAKFDKEKDTLICGGDLADGWNQVKELVDEMLKIKNRVDIVGNHDEWFRRYLDTGIHPDYWQQGGKGTFDSYHIREYGDGGIPESHKEFFRNQVLYYIREHEGKKQLFVHGGYNRQMRVIDVAREHPHDLYWNRDLLYKAMSVEKGAKLSTADNFDEIFLGHTATTYWDKTEPIFAGELVWNLDTGCGWDGKCTIMNVDTKEYWQSDPVKSLYPNVKGRGNYAAD